MIIETIAYIYFRDLKEIEELPIDTERKSNECGDEVWTAASVDNLRLLTDYILVDELTAIRKNQVATILFFN